MGELIHEIENSFIEYVVVCTKSTKNTSNQENEHLGKICALQDDNVVIDMTQSKSFKFNGSSQNKLHSISFKLNRLHYQLQHYAIEFILDHELFVRLIDNSDYRCVKPQQTRKVDAKANRLK